MLIRLSILPSTSPKSVKTERVFLYITTFFLTIAFGGTQNMERYGAFYMVITAFSKGD
jgi:hypothetical protein